MGILTRLTTTEWIMVLGVIVAIVGSIVIPIVLKKKNGDQKTSIGRIDGDGNVVGNDASVKIDKSQGVSGELVLAKLVEVAEAKGRAEAEKKLADINEQLKELEEAKLKKMEDKGKAQVKALIKEAEKRREESRREAERQRKISELWNEGLRAFKNENYESAANSFQQIVEDFKEEDAGVYYNWGTALLYLARRKEDEAVERLFAEAIGKYEKAVAIKPNKHEAYNNWGAALAELGKRKEGGDAEKLFAEAIAKCERAVAIKPDYCDAYNNLGVALLELAKCKEGEDTERLFAEAIGKFEKAVGIKPDYHEAYNNWGTVLSELARLKEGEDAERLFAEAFGKYEKAVGIKPDYYEAYNNWGGALTELARRKEGEEAEQFFAEAVAKFKKAISIKPDYYDAYNNWGAALLYLARLKKGDERKALLEEAKEKCLKAESIKGGAGAYNLACANCQLGDEGECRRWLKVGEKEDTLETREHAMKDEDLESVRNKEWFKGIRWKGE